MQIHDLVLISQGVPPPADKHTTAIMLTSGKQSADGAAPLEPITLSPFQLPSAQPLPWDVASAVQLPALARIRRSLQWAAAPSRIGEVQRREDMEKAKPVIVSGKSQPDDLAALAQQCIEGAKSSGYGSGELNTLITYVDTSEHHLAHADPVESVTPWIPSRTPWQ